MTKQVINTPDPNSPQFCGYTLSELQYRRDVNLVRQELLMEQLKSTYSEIRHRQEESSVIGYISKIDSIMSAAQYGIMGLTIFSKVKSFFRKMRKR